MKHTRVPAQPALIVALLLIVLTLTLAACGSTEPRAAAPAPPAATALTAQFFGTIDIRGSCVFVQSSISSSIQALIWPGTWTVTVAGDRVTMQAPNEGQITLAHGDHVELGGGAVQGPASVPGAAARVSPDCTGAFWLFSALPEHATP